MYRMNTWESQSALLSSASWSVVWWAFCVCCVSRLKGWSGRCWTWSRTWTSCRLQRNRRTTWWVRTLCRSWMWVAWPRWTMLWVHTLCRSWMWVAWPRWTMLWVHTLCRSWMWVAWPRWTMLWVRTLCRSWMWVAWPRWTMLWVHTLCRSWMWVAWLLTDPQTHKEYPSGRLCASCRWPKYWPTDTQEYSGILCAGCGWSKYWPTDTQRIQWHTLCRMWVA